MIYLFQHFRKADHDIKMQLTNSNEQESQARNSMTSFYSTQKQSLYISSLVNTTDDISSPRSIGPNSMYSIEQSAAQ